MHTKLKKYSYCFLILIFVGLIISCDSKTDDPTPTKKVVKSFKIEKKQKDQISPDKGITAVETEAVSSSKEKNGAKAFQGIDKNKKIAVPQRKQSETADISEKQKEVVLDKEGVVSVNKDSALDVVDPEGVDEDEEEHSGYNPEGRIDPFSPLFKPTHETVVKASDKPRSARQERLDRLTPLEKLDLSQLKLTGILKMPKAMRSMAMVEERTGKGHVIKKGTYIGVNSGRVIEINSNAVIIEEEVENYMGDIVVRKRELKLQKPLGER